MSFNKKYCKRNLFLIFILLFTTICFYYEDTLSNTRQGINLWKSLFSGQFFQYYSFNVQSKLAGEMFFDANYDMFLNLILAIWSFPLYIAELIVGTDIQNYFLARAWSKLFYPLAILHAGYLIKKIVLELNSDEESAENAFFMFSSGALVLTSGLIIGQVDIIGTIFILYAFLAFLKNRKIAFLLFFCLAVQCKSFAIFLYIPLILLKEKRILKIIPEILLPLLVTYLIGLPFSILDPTGVATKRPRLWLMLDFMTRTKISLMGVDIPVLFLLFIAVCMFAYRKNVPSKEAMPKWYMYICILGMLPILIGQLSYPQWMIYIIPFLVILHVTNPDQETAVRRLFLECAGTLSLLVGYMVRFQYVFNYDNLEKMLLNVLLSFDSSKPDLVYSFSSFIQDEKYFNVWTVSYGVFLVWIIGFMAEHYPDKKIACTAITEENKKLYSLLLNARAWAGFLLCNIPVFSYVFFQLFS